MDEAGVIGLLVAPDDPEAETVCKRWEHRGLVRMTPAHWHHHPWEIRLEGPTVNLVDTPHGNGTTLLRGMIVRLSEVRGLDMLHLAPEDRYFAAAEMQATLEVWLSSCRSPVVNRPIPGCLHGVRWSTARWRLEASRLGLPALAPAGRCPVGPTGAEQSLSKLQEATVVEDRVISTLVTRLEPRAQATRLEAGVRALARRAGVVYLRCWFAEKEGAPTFSHADTRPSLSDEAVAEAILDHLWRIA